MFPRIQFSIREDWGTMKLKHYLGRLLSDTRGGERRGFPRDVSEALLALSLANMDQLESIGIDLSEDPVVDFAIVKWELPRNF